MLLQVYLKLQSSCLLFPKEGDTAGLDIEPAVGMGMGHKVDLDEESDDDEIWNEMETVGEQRKRIKS